jgi:hypothetical protein
MMGDNSADVLNVPSRFDQETPAPDFQALYYGMERRVNFFAFFGYMPFDDRNGGAESLFFSAIA